MENKGTPEFDSIFTILKTIAHQIGVTKTTFDSKLDIVRSIYDKVIESTPQFYTKIGNNSTLDIASKLNYIMVEYGINPQVRPNKLTVNNNIWTFDRVPDIGEYVTGDLYAGSNKVGTYNGFTCENTLSGWEEAALAITSASFGNQAVSLLKEEGGNWQLK